jgi:spermidine synthase
MAKISFGRDRARHKRSITVETDMLSARPFMPAIFIFFLLSGFCSLLYEIVWLRLAMAQFGVTTALVSIVISSFMAGLGIGAVWSGRLLRRQHLQGPFALRLYAISELLIGVAAIVVPHEMLWGRLLFESTDWSSSAAYYVGSAFWLALTLVPWCAFMGGTIPLAMAALETLQSNSSTSPARPTFSYLYLANVLGALAGAVGAPLLVELYGFHGTLARAAGVNLLLAGSACTLSFVSSSARHEQPLTFGESVISSRSRWPLILLFATGLTSMGMEVVWIRQLTPYISTMVYSFACILATYLGSTYLGSAFYRNRLRRTAGKGIHTPSWIWPVVGFLGLLPLWSTDPFVSIPIAARVLLGITPFSALLGFLTPMLVDSWAGNNPDRAGRAYAINIAGCIVGPLLAGFVLLPLFGERWSSLILMLPWLLSAFAPVQIPEEAPDKKSPMIQMAALASVMLAGVLVVLTHGFADQFPRPEIRRDNTATIIAAGEGLEKRLIVNGVGITVLTPITKLMAHLPLAFLGRQPNNALVVCFGMGTTYRSMLSWNIPTTAVELVPSVPGLFWFFHADGPALLKSPLSHVVIDDGRRYLERSKEQFDVIAIDPPPPVEAAGSSLLYSKEFYVAARARLRPDGILQQWLPNGDPMVESAVTKALTESFPHVRIFRSIEGWGTHFLASTRPIPAWSAKELLQRMPPSAVADMMEWGPKPTPEAELDAVLKNEISPARLIDEYPAAPALTDDRPVNEYYALRRGANGGWFTDPKDVLAPRP